MLIDPFQLSRFVYDGTPISDVRFGSIVPVPQCPRQVRSPFDSRRAGIAVRRILAKKLEQAGQDVNS